MTFSIKQLALALLKPNFILAGIVLVFLLAASWYDATINDGQVHLYGPGGWRLFWRPLFFLIMFLALLFRKSWSHLIAALSSGMLIYLVGWLYWSGISQGEGVPMFSKDMFVIWYGEVARYEPQAFTELALAMLVFGYSVISLLRRKITKRLALSHADV